MVTAQPVSAASTAERLHCFRAVTETSAATDSIPQIASPTILVLAASAPASEKSSARRGVGLFHSRRAR